MANIYVVAIHHEVYGPFNERGLKPLVSSSMYEGKAAYETREEAEKAITDMLNMHEQIYTAWIGRKPDSRIDKLNVESDPEAYIAYNIDADDVEKIQMSYPDVVSGGAIEVVMTMEKLPFISTK